jgi:hypothetical protein
MLNKNRHNLFFHLFFLILHETFPRKYFLGEPQRAYKVVRKQWNYYSSQCVEGEKPSHSEGIKILVQDVFTKKIIKGT